jgi:hypothetical protein
MLGFATTTSSLRGQSPACLCRSRAAHVVREMLKVVAVDVAVLYGIGIGCPFHDSRDHNHMSVGSCLICRIRSRVNPKRDPRLRDVIRASKARSATPAHTALFVEFLNQMISSKPREPGVLSLSSQTEPSSKVALEQGTSRLSSHPICPKVTASLHRRASIHGALPAGLPKTTLTRLLLFRYSLTGRTP